jgi:hypothetical protein
MPRGVGDFLGLTAVAIVVAATGLQGWRSWHGAGKKDAIRGLWFLPVSRTAKNAFWRTTPVSLLMLLLVVAIAVAELIVGSKDSVYLFLFDIVAIAALGLLMFFMWTVMLWNHPKFLVPPPYRREAGLIALWRRRRRIRKASRRCS